MLEVVGLFAGYGKRQVLSEVEISVAPGQLSTVIGANGAGKTTLLRVISGQLRSSSGSVSVLGHDLRRTSPAKLVRAGLAHVPEGRHIFPRLSVRDHLLLGGYAHDRSGMRRATQAQMSIIYELFPRLAERQKQYAGSLSGGEQQMLVIGRALMSRPKLLLIDEPSLGLAPIIVNSIMKALVELRAGDVSVLLVEQNAAMALEFADSGFVMESGRMVLSGPTRDLRADARVRDAYLG